MKNMMLQVRNFSTIVLSAVLLLAAGCKDKNSEPEDPFVTSGNMENPNWQVTADNSNPYTPEWIVAK